MPRKKGSPLNEEDDLKQKKKVANYLRSERVQDAFNFLACTALYVVGALVILGICWYIFDSLMTGKQQELREHFFTLIKFASGYVTSELARHGIFAKES